MHEVKLVGSGSENLTNDSSSNQRKNELSVACTNGQPGTSSRRRRHEPTATTTTLLCNNLLYSLPVTHSRQKYL